MNLAAHSVPASDPALASCVQRMAREASLELNHLEAGEIRKARDLLLPGQRVYVSHLPRQTWAQTSSTCARVSEAGFEPVPHIPVRRLTSERELDQVLSASRDAGARELLLISGDSETVDGPYSSVYRVLESGRIQAHGFSRLSVAGHPEGHPVVPAKEMRQAEADKARWAERCGIQVTFVTQFFFEAQPFVDWAFDLREHGIRARLVAGLPGPANVAKLIRLGRLCGIGTSIRALTSRPGAMLKLMSERKPDSLVHELAQAELDHPGLCNGIHLFSFGGFLHTADWLRRVAEGQSSGSA